MSPYRLGDGSGWTPDWYKRYNPGGGYTNPHRVSNRPTRPAQAAHSRTPVQPLPKEPWWVWALLALLWLLLAASPVLAWLLSTPR